MTNICLDTRPIPSWHGNVTLSIALVGLTLLGCADDDDGNPRDSKSPIFAGKYWMCSRCENEFRESPDTLAVQIPLIDKTLALCGDCEGTVKTVVSAIQVLSNSDPEDVIVDLALDWALKGPNQEIERAVKKWLRDRAAPHREVKPPASLFGATRELRPGEFRRLAQRLDWTSPQVDSLVKTPEDRAVRLLLERGGEAPSRCLLCKNNLPPTSLLVCPACLSKIRREPKGGDE